MTDIIDIDGLAFGGSGVGRIGGKAVFVPYTTPGDRARIRLVSQKKRYAHGELVELVEPAPQRITPACPVFGRCGGCQWQHLSYTEQMRWKEQIFAETLGRQAGIDPELLLPAVAAPDPWNYRSRVQFKCRMTDGGFVMGFYRRGSHYVVDAESCPVVLPGINQLLSLFRQSLASAPDPQHIPQVDVAQGDDGQLRAVVHYIGTRRQEMTAFLLPLAQEGGFSLFLQDGRKKAPKKIWGEEGLEIRPCPDLKLEYGPGGFAQINLDQNRALVSEVLESVALTGRERVLDLFCGMGNFSLPLAPLAAEVIGVEDFAPSIAQARINARRNGIDNAEFLSRPAEGAAGELGRDRKFDLVLLDPPRSGADQVVRELAALRVDTIVYVSCDPATLARDLKHLLQNGYRLERSRAFDLFPQTHHTESVTLLRRC